MPPQKFTEDNAREMQLRSAESRRRNREEAQRVAEEEWRKALTRALEKHLALIDAEAEPVAMSAVKELYERLLGKAAQPVELEHSGSVSIVVGSMFDNDHGSTAGQGDSSAERVGGGVDEPPGDPASGVGGDPVR